MHRVELAIVMKKSREREAAWVWYGEAMDVKLAKVIRTIDDLSAAWINEQRRSRELATVFVELARRSCMTQGTY